MIQDNISILFSLSHTITLLCLKYFIRFYFTSNFCKSSALSSIRPTYLSVYPTLNYYLFKLDHRILSNIAFAVLNFFTLFGYSLCWFGHWIMKMVSLYAWMKNALPSANSSQLSCYSNFLLLLYFYLCFMLKLLGSIVFFFFFWFCPRLLFLRFPFSIIYNSSSIYSSEPIISLSSFFYTTTKYSYSSLSSFSCSEPFLLFYFFIFVQ